MHFILFQPKIKFLIYVFVMVRYVFIVWASSPGTMHTNEYSFSSGQKLFVYNFTENERQNERNIHTFGIVKQIDRKKHITILYSRQFYYGQK